MKKLLLIIIPLLLTGDMMAAEADSSVVEQPRKLSLIRRIIRGFDRLDTDYIEPQHYVFTAMVQGTFVYDFYTLRTRGDNEQSVTFAPDGNLKIGPYFGWKWVFAGYTFSLGHSDFSKNKTELGFSLYSSQIGLDLFYRRTGSDCKLRNIKLGNNIDTRNLENISFGGLKSGITGVNLYYIFNHGRFSYPAAFAQSTIQKVNCGSWMAGFGFTKHSLELDHEELESLLNERLAPQTVVLDSGLMFKSVQYNDLNISGGYSYNWVFARNWLFNVTGQLGVGYKKSSGDVAGSGLKNFNFENLNLDAIGRFALVYNNMRWYAGISAFIHSYNYRKSRIDTNNTFGSMNMYVGYNFGLMKKYRKDKDD